MKKALHILKIQDDFKNYKLYTGPHVFLYDMTLKRQHEFKKHNMTLIPLQRNTVICYELNTGQLIVK